MQKLIMLGVALAMLLTTMPARSAPGVVRTHVRLQGPAPYTVFVEVCGSSCEEQFTFCEPVDVMSVLKTYRTTCMSAFDPTDVRVFRFSLGTTVDMIPDAPTPSGGYEVKIGGGKF